MNSETLHYVRQHADDDVRQLALRGCKDPQVDLRWALDQIAGRQTARKKLPSWAAIDDIHYPPHLSMEQCSSETTACYKALLARRLLLQRESMADLTGGFGVDCSFLAREFKRAVYVEQQEHLCLAAQHNFQLLGLQATEVVCANATDYLPRLSHTSLIFLDPARRDANGQRTYSISDCTPDVLTMLSELLSKCDVLLLKLSPMLDWRKAVADLGTEHVAEIHIVSVQGECKELLIVLRPETSQDIVVFCVDDGSCYTFTEGEPPSSQQSQHALSMSSSPLREPYAGDCLYEPNASVMKAGCFSSLQQQFAMTQIAPNSHLFLSASPQEDFPGRAFRIKTMTTMNKRDLRNALNGITQANISVRNFPLSVADLRKRLRLSDGGDTYIFATTLSDARHVLFICEKQ